MSKQINVPPTLDQSRVDAVIVANDLLSEFLDDFESGDLLNVAAFLAMSDPY